LEKEEKKNCEWVTANSMGRGEEGEKKKPQFTIAGEKKAGPRRIRVGGKSQRESKGKSQ